MDALEDLARLLQDRKRCVADPGAWPAIRDEWVADLERLMTRLDEWLEPLRQAGLLDINKQNVRISESPDIPDSDYVAPARLLLSPDHVRVEILPRARGVFGASGRVDILGRNRLAMLGRFAPGEWHFVWQEPAGAEWQSRPLTPESLAATLKEMLA